MSTTRQADLGDVEQNDRDTCPNGYGFCPVENPGAAREDALCCFDCFVEAGAR